MFKLKSDASRVGSNIQETTSSLVQGAKDAGNKILDVGTSRGGSNNGLLDDNSWRLTVGFFAALIVVSIAGAVLNHPPDGANPSDYGNPNYGTIDKFTSDGQPLQFGSRS
uniref:Uncharacterized protein n=1 Tax=Haptolina ericina TaxID=156174 RepID=A0A7S3BQ93_9EUKA